MQLPYRISVIGIAALVALAIACSSGESDPFPTAAPAATSTPVPADADDDHADDGHDDDDKASNQGTHCESSFRASVIPKTPPGSSGSG